MTDINNGVNNSTDNGVNSSPQQRLPVGNMYAGYTNPTGQYIPYIKPQKLSDKLKKQSVPVGAKDYIFAVITFILCVFGVHAVFF
jgi:hypothetical protein